MATASPTATPKLLKKLEKEVLKEGKAEEKFLKYAMKELSELEKSQGKAQKEAVKAEQAVSKSEQKELQAAKELNKAEYAHEVAVTTVRGMEKDAELKHRHQLKVQQELDAKKAQIEALMSEQQTHNHNREQKLSEIRAGHIPGTSPSPPNAPVGSTAGEIPGMPSPTIPGGYTEPKDPNATYKGLTPNGTAPPAGQATNY